MADEINCAQNKPAQPLTRDDLLNIVSNLKKGAATLVLFGCDEHADAYISDSAMFLNHVFERDLDTLAAGIRALCAA
jgi:hypothetical protein